VRLLNGIIVVTHSIASIPITRDEGRVSIDELLGFHFFPKRREILLSNSPIFEAGNYRVLVRWRIFQ
jgi:hypothetical protein